MSDDVVLPDLHEALLDDATLAQLFFDLEAAAEVIDVRLKGQAEARADEGVVTLRTARAGLESNAVQGVQIRYRFAGAEWWDTLIRTPSGVRLVRIRPDLPT